MKVLVLGGAGYIGSHVVRELLDSGYSVTVFDNLSTGSKDNLFSEAEFVEGDILNSKAIKNVMKKRFDAIFHFAALKAAGESMIIPQKYSENNICGTINILNAATESKVKYFVFSSSAAVYGEPEYLPLDEEHPTHPQNYYGFTKLEIERILFWYDKLCNIKFAALRYFNAAGYDIKKRIYGLERNPQNLLPIVMEVAVKARPYLNIFGNDYPTRDGTGIRDYIHVNDLASAHLKALEYLISKNESITVNLGNEKGISVLEIVEEARRITGREIPIKITDRRAGDSAIVYSSSAKANRLLGWKAQYSDVETLIRSMWEVYKKNFTVE
ncbi:MAG: UDP-glucose 4-epimerase GalE [Chitinispirillaceae bacterium]|nr:UDP-glucose 4-epimerase GalE [Chitinispirillaceae bacterium]